ncbi:Maleylacetate reductase [compost metagenome]
MKDCSPAAALFDLSCSLGAPTRLKDLGLTEADLDRATDIALSNPYWNPRPIEAVAIRQLLQDAFDGIRPK